MAQFTFEIPDAIVPRVLNAFVQANSQFDPNDPPTQPQKVAIFRRRLIEHIRGVVVRAEAEAAAETARRTTAAQASIDIVVV